MSSLCGMAGNIALVFHHKAKFSTSMKLILEFVRKCILKGTETGLRDKFIAC